jgi:cytochrome c biogenesis protein CcdA
MIVEGRMKTAERAFVVVFGFFLLFVGIYAAFSGAASAAWRYIGGGVLIALGANAVYGGVVGKRPWISRIGPLP